MAELEDSCFAARDALNRVGDVELSMRALERKFDRSETDRIRLGERVTTVEENMRAHETLTQQAVQKFNNALSGLNETVDSLKEIVVATAAAPPVPTGIAVIRSWRDTPVSARAKIVGAIVAILTSSEVIRFIIRISGEYLSRFIHH